MNNFIKSVSSTTILIAYFFTCGSLYLIGYWSNFNIDISSFVAIWDVPKVFVFPFVVATALALFYQLLIYLMHSDMDARFIKSRRGLNVILLKKKGFGWLLLRQLLFTTFFLELLIGFVPLFYLLFKDKYLFWSISCIIVCIVVINRLKRKIYIRRCFSSRAMMHIVITTSIVTPAFSFGYAKVKGMKVYNNTDIMYIMKLNKNTNSIISDTIRNKFLGFLGDKAIISSLDNEKIIVLNQDDFSGFELSKKE